MTPAVALLVLATVALAGCGPSGPGGEPATEIPVAAASATAAASPGAVRRASVGMGGRSASPAPKPSRPGGGVLRAGNPNGGAAVPAEARMVDTSRPTRVVGNGTAASCTSDAVVKAVAAGGTITFDCDPEPGRNPTVTGSKLG
ncbi:hypothetical protein [Micromonospora inyonensis]|uniref:Uncharacterized protein n=1 Tax=Micromonospora inyonensis TaxID=47866 RepID=A0A1C6RHJ1_9ACTN|nr:hypothetical protein [Micromonospora inyonensis]SCL16597.1 hypothetical protein GA0074694_1683 [Micromonospora inyonensis]